jgi:hypothetical protein
MSGGWEMRPPPVSPFDTRSVGWHGIARAANLPSRTAMEFEGLVSTLEALIWRKRLN